MGWGGGVRLFSPYMYENVRELGQKKAHLFFSTRIYMQKYQKPCKVYYYVIH